MPAPLIALAKNVQGSKPANAKRGYGTGPDETPARRPKKMLKTIIVMSGWRTAQAAPSAVCLYLTLTSRQVRKKSSSRPTKLSEPSVQVHSRLRSVGNRRYQRKNGKGTPRK